MSEKRPWEGQKLLLVDDSSMIRRQIQPIFTEIGFDVIDEAENGLLAIEKFNALKPDIVSLDIIMPELNGIDCFVQMTKIHPPSKFIFISCLAATYKKLGDKNKLLENQHLLDKPLQKKELLLALQALYQPKR